MKNPAKYMLIVLLLNLVWVGFPIAVSDCDAQENGVREKGETDVQWFKDKMGISEKYAGETEGVYGMSWAHFIAMVLMVGFIAATFVVVYLRNRRTRLIINELLKEEEQNGL